MVTVAYTSIVAWEVEWSDVEASQQTLGPAESFHRREMYNSQGCPLQDSQDRRHFPPENFPNLSFVVVPKFEECEAAADSLCIHIGGRRWCSCLLFGFRAISRATNQPATISRIINWTTQLRCLPAGSHYSGLPQIFITPDMRKRLIIKNIKTIPRLFNINFF